MDKEKLLKKIARSLGVSVSEKELAFEIFMSRLAGIIHPGETLRIPDVGFFQVRDKKRDAEDPVDDQDTVIYTPLASELERSESSMFLTLKLPFKKKSMFDLDTDVFSLSAGKPVLPISEKDISDDQDASYLLLKKSIEQRADEVLSTSERLENFDLFEDYFSSVNTTPNLRESEVIDIIQELTNDEQVKEKTAEYDKVEFNLVENTDDTGEVSFEPDAAESVDEDVPADEPLNENPVEDTHVTRTSTMWGSYEENDKDTEPSSTTDFGEVNADEETPVGFYDDVEGSTSLEEEKENEETDSGFVDVGTNGIISLNEEDSFEESAGFVEDQLTVEENFGPEENTDETFPDDEGIVDESHYLAKDKGAAGEDSNWNFDDDDEKKEENIEWNWGDELKDLGGVEENFIEVKLGNKRRNEGEKESVRDEFKETLNDLGVEPQPDQTADNEPEDLFEELDHTVSDVNTEITLEESTSVEEIQEDEVPADSISEEDGLQTTELYVDNENTDYIFKTINEEENKMSDSNEKTTSELKNETPSEEPLEYMEEEKSIFQRYLLAIISAFVIVVVIILYFFVFDKSQPAKSANSEMKVTAPPTEQTAAQTEETGGASAANTAGRGSRSDSDIFRTLKKDTRVSGRVFFDGTSYNVQVSAWRDKNKAINEAKKLRASNHAAFVVEAEIPSKGGTWYRVRVGDFKSKQEAETFLVNNNL